MIIADVHYKSIRPLLMHSNKAMLMTGSGGVSSKRSRLEKDPEYEAEQGAYRDPEGYLVIPRLNLKSNVVEGSKIAFRTKRGTGFSSQQMVRGSIYIEPDMPRLKDWKGKTMKSYEIDAQIVRNPSTGGRQPSYRPRIDEWTLDFQIRWNPMLYGLTPAMVRDSVEKGGILGLCDYRPDYGIFEVTKFESKED